MAFFTVLEVTEALRPAVDRTGEPLIPSLAALLRTLLVVPGLRVADLDVV